MNDEQHFLNKYNINVEKKKLHFIYSTVVLEL